MNIKSFQDFNTNNQIDKYNLLMSLFATVHCFNLRLNYSNSLIINKKENSVLLNLLIEVPISIR